MKIFYILLLLVSTAVFAQNNEKKWDKVIAFENEGKIKLASETVDKIYKKAKSNQNEDQIIKCFFYKSKYLQTLEDNAKSKIISNLQTEIEQVSIPSKAILNLILIKCLKSYQTANNYKLYNRSKTDSISSNFLNWSNADFDNEIDAIYQKTLENETVLKNTKLDEYEQIFDFLDLQKFKNENLYNYLLQENLVYYTSKINRWGYQYYDFFDFRKSILSQNTNDFVKINFDFIKDEKFKKVIQLYQKIEIENPSFENILDRIKFCNDYIVKDNKLFLISLNNLQKTTNDKILFQKLMNEKANIISTLASKKEFPTNNILAVSILDSVIDIDNHSNYYKLAKRKKSQITSRNLNIELQKNWYPNENNRAFLNYKNIDNFTVSFYKINQKTLRDLSNFKINRDSLTAQIIAKNQLVVNKKYELQNKKDYFEYTTEIVLPQLEIGSYFVYFESNGNSENLKATAINFINVSNIMVAAISNYTNEKYQILDRKTGKPIENATLQNKFFSLKSNIEGEVYVKNDKKTKTRINNYDSFEVFKDNDTIVFSKNYINHYNDFFANNETIKSKIEMYSDRTIYRPGQKVFYKGIAIQKIDNKSKVLPNLKLKFKVQNNEDIDVSGFEAVTNDFGSFSGEFDLPKNILTGNVKIIIDKDFEENDSIYFDMDFEEFQFDFKVEEYKRPKFEVTIEKNKNTYVFDQKITVKGSAKAFSGSNISNAVVKYAISKNMEYDYRNHLNNEYNAETIEDKEITTDSNGNFVIEFIATPFEDMDKTSQPIISYNVKVDVIDVNGETHSAATTVRVGFHSLQINGFIPNVIETKNKNTILLNTSNLNGEFVPTKGELKFYFVRNYENKFKNRVFQKPEIEGITNSQFEKLFPNEKNEINKLEERLLQTLTFDTEKHKTVFLDFMQNYQSGFYKVVCTATDKFDNPVEKTTYFQVNQSNDLYNLDKLFFIEQLNDDAKKDGFILLKIKSVIDELYLNTTGNYLSEVFYQNNIWLKNHEAILKIPLENSFENAVKIGFECVFDNQNFNSEIEVFLKDEKPKLEFEVLSFRNKIEPGSNENWSFKLKSAQTSIDAEVLASMYDSSLDQFATKNWQSLQFHEKDYNYISNRTHYGFEKAHINFTNLNAYLHPLELTNEKSQLAWFGFDFNNSKDVSVTKNYKRTISKKSKKPANAKMIYGTVSDTSGTLPGAIVIVKGTHRSTQTDMEGYYEIEAAVGETLVFSFVGMEDFKIKVGENKVYNVKLKEGNQLETVVVTAMGFKTKKASISSSYSVINGKDGKDGESALRSLQGKVSGVQISGNGNDTKISIRGALSITETNEALVVVDGVISDANVLSQISPDAVISINVLKGAQAVALYGSQGANGVIIITTTKSVQELTQVKARKNLSETAFFLPHLKTDDKGKVSFNFKSPEALTTWKLRLLAHNKNGISSYLVKNTITQKDLMVTPNFPRFFREKDSITITTKISNITNETKTGIAVLQLFDATNMQNVDAKTMNVNSIKNFTIPAYGNTTVSWKIYIPEGLEGIDYKVLAKAGNFSDGEENILPVLTNNILVTESIPVWVRENSKKEFVFENLKNNNSQTLKNHQFTLEYTSNPTWIALQALPYLMEFEHECAEQTFARLFANMIASEVINSNPKISKVFENWIKNGKNISKLEQNEELKSLILAETPWLNDAKSEDEKKKNLALLFDLEKMKLSTSIILDKLKQKQKTSGGFGWFDGSDENEFITRHIIAGFGHLSKLVKDTIYNAKIKEITEVGIGYLDKKFVENYKKDKQNIKDKKYKNYSNLHYLYARSFYLKTNPIGDSLNKISHIYIENIKDNWLELSLYEKGMAALSLHRFGENLTAKKIIDNLKQTASNNEDWGMYWIENKVGRYWHQAPIETQAMLIEAFAEMENDIKSVDKMKVWLLKNKQSKNWQSTKSTTEAIYALLMQGTDWLSLKDNTIIKIGDKKIITKKLLETDEETETGYIKLTWKGNEIKQEMANISIENKSKSTAFGGLYWQYFEDSDKIKANSGSAISVGKQLYHTKTTANGNELVKIDTKNGLKIGDLITIKLTIIATDDLEFIHLKNMRASCFEPTNVLSECKYTDGLGYYMSTKDAATHFFFDKITKGTYQLEYTVRVNNSGDFSNGITTIESMYAPEFTSHTKGIRVTAK